MLSDIATKTAERRPGIDAAHMQTGGEGTGGALMVICNQGKGRRNVAGLADTHQRPGDEQLLEVGRMPCQPGDCRPDKQA